MGTLCSLLELSCERLFDQLAAEAAEEGSRGVAFLANLVRLLICSLVVFLERQVNTHRILAFSAPCCWSELAFGGGGEEGGWREEEREGKETGGRRR